MEKYNKNFKQMVEIPQMVSPTIFALPCVTAVQKDSLHAFVLHLSRVQYLDGSVANWAMPGEWLAIDTNGQWWVIKQSEA